MSLDVSLASDAEFGTDSRLFRRASSLAIVLAIPMALLAAWEVGARASLLPPYLVSPSVVAATGAQMIADGDLWANLSVSLSRCYLGFILGGCVGVGAGLLAGVVARLRGFLDPLVSLSYPIPKIAVLPILMGWLGLGDPSKIAIIGLSVFFPLYISAQQGALSVDPLHVWAARTFGASKIRIFFRVIVPASLPAIFGGVRTGLALSFIMLFATEMVSANKGLGYLIVQAQMYQRFDIMFVAVATIGMLGFLSDRIVVFIQRRVLIHYVRSAK